MATWPSFTLPLSVPSIQLAAVEAPPEVNSLKGPEGLMGETVQQSQAKNEETRIQWQSLHVRQYASRFSYFEALLHVSVLCCRFLSRIRKA